jgi:O-methyltransferase
MDADVRTAYLELLKQCLTRALFVEEERSRGRRRRVTALVMSRLASRGYIVVPAMPSVEGRAVQSIPGLAGSKLLTKRLERRGLAVVPDTDHPRIMGTSMNGRRLRRWSQRLARVEREFGLDHPEHAETMVGLRRLDNIEACVADAVRRGVPGDLVEAGVWRGGSTILMRAVLAAYDDPDRRVWVADSFRGVPKSNPESFPADAGVDYTVQPELSVGLRDVRENFARYGLLDDRVQFLPGWFRDTLSSAPIEQLAVLRVDGDLYESTIDALESLYPKLSPGGYCIIDDYGVLEPCRRAVDDYRRAHDITDQIQPVDWTGAYWRRGDA